MCGRSAGCGSGGAPFCGCPPLPPPSLRGPPGLAPARAPLCHMPHLMCAAVLVCCCCHWQCSTCFHCRGTLQTFQHQEAALLPRSSAAWSGCPTLWRHCRLTRPEEVTSQLSQAPKLWLATRWGQAGSFTACSARPSALQQQEAGDSGSPSHAGWRRHCPVAFAGKLLVVLHSSRMRWPPSHALPPGPDGSPENEADGTVDTVPCHMSF